MDLGPLIQTHGYWVVAIGCVLEGESVLVLAGIAAHAGLLDPRKVVAVAAVSAFAGDQVYFWLGRWYGPAILRRMPRVASQADRMQRLIDRHRAWVVVGLRFAYGLRIAGAVLIGASGLRPWRFLVFNALGAVLWATLVVTLGWSLGHAAEALIGRVGHVAAALVIGLLVAALGYALSQRACRRK